MGKRDMKMMAPTVVGLFLLLAGCIDLPVDVITYGTDDDPTGGDAFAPGEPGPFDVKFTLDSRKGVQPIASGIYGFNTTNALAGNNTASLHFGSDRITAYNWETNDSNSSALWDNQNDELYIDPLDNTPGAPVRKYLQRDVELTDIAIPIGDYVAADHDASLGDVINSGPDYLETRFKRNLPRKNAPFSLYPDTTDPYVYQDEFVNWVKDWGEERHVIISLDNDVDRWSELHPRLRPEGPLTLDELVTRNTDFARAVKDVWPTVEVGGFVGKTWLGLAALHTDTTRTDPLIVTRYIERMRETGDAENRRLIDYLEVHYFPDVYEASSEGAATARMQAPRAFWDDTYTDTVAPQTTTWLGGEGLALIRRLKAVIAKTDPELKLLIGSWSFGAPDHISGAIAVADTLGIFGREGVAAAMNFDFVADQTSRDYLDAGFRMFRNYDREKSTFGDTAFSAETDDIERTSVYASFDADNPERVVIIAINKSPESVNVGITLAHTVVYHRMERYVLKGDSPEIAAAPAIESVDTNAFLYPMPPHSVTVLLPKP